MSLPFVAVSPGEDAESQASRVAWPHAPGRASQDGLSCVLRWPPPRGGEANSPAEDDVVVGRGKDLMCCRPMVSLKRSGMRSQQEPAEVGRMEER